MAKQAVKVELFYDNTWNDITADAYARDPIKIKHGRAGEDGQLTPSQAQLTLRNVDGTYNPRNPLSPLFGKVGRNTPIRVTVGTDIRFAGEVASWAPQRSRDDRDAWTGVVANGISRRLRQGEAPLRSTMYRYITTRKPVGYWPLDTGRRGEAGKSPIGGEQATLAADVARPKWVGFGIGADTVNTAEQVSNTGAYVDLATLGPQADVVVGASGRIVVMIGAGVIKNTTSAGAAIGFEISGASSQTAADDQAILYQELDGSFTPTAENNQLSWGKSFLVEGLNPGSITVTMKYKSTGGTNTIFDRHLVVIPL